VLNVGAGHEGGLTPPPHRADNRGMLLQISKTVTALGFAAGLAVLYGARRR
jgi:hypothetical protein